MNKNLLEGIMRKYSVIISSILAAALLSSSLGGFPDALGRFPAASAESTLAASDNLIFQTSDSEDPTPDSELSGKLLITEIMEKNHATLPDEDGDFPDWLELANISDEPISLSGFRIADRDGRKGWHFPDVSLASGERLILFASKKDRQGTFLHTDFALSGSDCICLYDSMDHLVDRALCGGCEADVAYALQPDGIWSASLYPTPGFENTASGYDFFQETLSPRGPLVLNEIAVKNLGINVAGTSTDCDWIEIRNISNASVTLSDYYLSDKDDEPFLWRMPDRSLAPGAVLVVVCESPDSGFYGTSPCTGFSLNASHEELYLRHRTGDLIDWADLRDIPAGGSYGRKNDKAGFFFFASPTPGAANAGGKRRVSAPPVCLTKDGVFEDTESVMLEISGSGTLRYTINDSAPTEDSTLYTDPIEITETCVVSVKNYEPDALPSRTLSLTYIINEGHTLPVASFVAEDFTDFSSIYSSTTKLYKMPGSLSFYRDEDSFKINCAVNLNGATSLVLTKKNLAVHFSGAYGTDTLEHDIFGSRPYSFTDLLLRAGQDQFQTVIRNELAQRLAEKAEAQVINQRSIYCVLYLNGTYAGIYTIKDRPNESLYAGIAAVDEDSVECVEAPAAYQSDLYNATVGFVNSHDMSLDKNYDLFCENVDIDSLIDWLIIEGFCANTDLTSGNLRYARSYLADGRWHLLFYDLDAAFRSFDSIQRNLLNEYAAQTIQVSAFCYPLLKNATFCDQFLTRAASLLRGPLSNESVIGEIDRLCDELRPEIPRDFALAGSSISSWERSIDELKAMIEGRDWCQANVDVLCRVFSLDAAAREAYFGDIDVAAD